MLDAMAEHFPQEARWTRPSGGLFIWVELPAHVNTTILLNQAVEEAKVAFVPGAAFDTSADPVKGPAENCMRLSFANCSSTAIEEGIGRLGKLLLSYC
jgi:2-aminoadipate transaminase